MRGVTAALALIAVVAGPIAPMACAAGCELALKHPSICHQKEHAHFGPHVHHMGHLRMIHQQEDQSVAAPQPDPTSHMVPLGCTTAGCGSLAITALATRPRGLLTRAGIPLLLLVPVTSSPKAIISSRTWLICDNPDSESLVVGISAPLRV